MEKNNFEKKTVEEDAQEKIEQIGVLENTNNILDITEDQIDIIADTAISNTDEITKKLKLLSATEEEIKAILEKVSWVDKDIYKKAEKVKLGLQEQIISYYEENFQNLHNSIIAEFKIRPIHSKIEKLIENIGRENQNDADILAGHVGLGRGKSSIYSIAKILKNYEGIADKVLPKDTISAAKNYNEFIQHRKYEEVFTLSYNYRSRNSDMDILYAANLNKIIDCKDEEQIKYLKAYFEKSSKMHTDANSHHIFSKIDRVPESQDINLNHSWDYINLPDRVDAFVQFVSENNISLEKDSTLFLKEKILEMTDPQERYPERASKASRSLGSFQQLVDLAGFSETEKDIIYRKMFVNLVSIPYHPMSKVLENAEFPYSLEEKHTILKLITKDANDGEYLNFVGTKIFSSSPEIKEIVKEEVFRRLSSRINDHVSWGDYKTLLEFEKDQIRKFTENGLLKNEDGVKLSQKADEAFLPSIESFIENNTKKNRFNISQLSLLMVDLHKIPEKYTEEVKEKLENSAWAKSVEKILSIYKHSRRQEYDKWHTDINPLARSMVEQGILDSNKIEDSKIFFEYIKKVGPVNLPNYFKLFTEIKRNDSVLNMTENLKSKIKSNFDIDVDKLCEKDPTNINLLLNEIERYRQTITQGLVNEDILVINKVLSSDFGKEFLTSIKGDSGHSQGGTMEETLNTYRKKYESSPELFQIPEGYKETNISVGEYGTENRESIDIDKHLSDLFNNPDLVNFHEKIFQAIKSLDENKNISLDEKLSFYNQEVILEINDQLALTMQNMEIEEQKEQKNEKLVIGLNKKKSLLEKSLADLTSVNIKQKTIPEIMEAYNSVVPDDFKSKQELLMSLSLMDMAKKFPSQMEKLNNKDMFTSKPSADSVSILSEFIRSHVAEHYLDKKHGETDAAAISDKNTIKYLKKIWGTQDFEKGILANTEKKLEILERGELSQKKKEITLIPSKGMQRIFSGDLGGACTSRRNLELAKGEYENIISYSLVIDKNTSQAKFTGSFLVVETKTDRNEPILVIRANNPSQNLSQIVDPNELIEKIIGEVKKVGEIRGIKKIGVAYNSGSASNRGYVVEYYQKSFKRENAISLKNTKETNFNGYPIYNKSGAHPVVLV